jgi:hypothetical protein
MAAGGFVFIAAMFAETVAAPLAAEDQKVGVGQREKVGEGSVRLSEWDHCFGVRGPFSITSSRFL